MGFYGKWETYKIVYYPKNSSGGIRGVAFVEAGDKAHAMQVFRELYGGQYHTVENIEQITGN